MKKIVYLMACLPLLLAGCSVLGLPQQTEFSFENGMDGWTAAGTDLENPTDEWSIDRSEDMATEGHYSLKLSLNNMNDAGKIWVQRAFNVESDSYYQVHLDYDFASADYGDLNLWTIITGAQLEPPTTADELTYQRDTGNGGDQDDGFKWLHKTYTFDLRTGPEKQIYVVIGVWGTYEVARTYYIDNITVTTVKS